MKPFRPACQTNDPRKPGAAATCRVFFGPNNRFLVGARHTRGAAVQWVVWDTIAAVGPAMAPREITTGDNFDDVVDRVLAASAT